MPKRRPQRPLPSLAPNIEREVPERDTFPSAEPPTPQPAALPAEAAPTPVDYVTVWTSGTVLRDALEMHCARVTRALELGYEPTGGVMLHREGSTWHIVQAVWRRPS